MCTDAEAGRHVCAPEGGGRPVAQESREQGKEQLVMGLVRWAAARPYRAWLVLCRFWKGSGLINLTFAEGHYCRVANIGRRPSTGQLKWPR